MTIYMVSLYRLTASKNDLGMVVNNRDSLGNTLFEDKLDAEMYAAGCVALGIDAFVFPRAVVCKETELSVAS